MKFWICKITNGKELKSGEERIIRHSSYPELFISKNDIVFVVDNSNPTIIYGWGEINEFSIKEKIIIGDDEEANSSPYQTYFEIIIKVKYSEVFTLPISLSMYLSEKDFDSYYDRYENEYKVGLKEIPDWLVEKLKLISGHVGSIVFLSYAREDLEFAKKLYQSLINSGIRVWFDIESLLPGQNWKHEIQKAISESEAFIALLSKKSINKRGYVQKELRLGLGVFEQIPYSNIYLIPVRCEECYPEHPTLKDLHWVDMFPDFEIGFKKIISSIKLMKS